MYYQMTTFERERSMLTRSRQNFGAGIAVPVGGERDGVEWGQGKIGQPTLQLRRLYEAK
jgi:hypothetical protein